MTKLSVLSLPVLAPSDGEGEVSFWRGSPVPFSSGSAVSPREGKYSLGDHICPLHIPSESKGPIVTTVSRLVTYLCLFSLPNHPPPQIDSKEIFKSTICKDKETRRVTTASHVYYLSTLWAQAAAGGSMGTDGGGGQMPRWPECPQSHLCHTFQCDLGKSASSF